MNFKNKKCKIIFSVAAVLIAAAVFFAGFFLSKLFRKGIANSYNWAVTTIQKYYYEDISEERLLKAAMEGGVTSLLDIYSAYYTADEYAAVVSSNGGSKSGLGVSYSYVGGKGVLLNTIYGNSPAYICGLRAGLFLLRGTDKGGGAVEFTSAEAFGDYVNSFAAGEEMTFTASDGREYTVAKAEYTASYAAMCTNATSWRFEGLTEGDHLPLKEDQTEKMSFLPDGAAYIRLSQFYGDAVWEFGQLVTKFNAEGCTSLILDLRNNGGGYVSVMQALSYYFTADVKDCSNLAMYAEYKSGKRENFYVTAPAVSACLPSGTDVYVLANSGTASASEALIGVLISGGITEYSHVYLSDYSEEYLEWAGGSEKTAQTYGKGIMQSTFVNFSTGDALKLTTAKIYWPNGTCIHGVGLTAADGCKTVAAEWPTTYGDEELRLAVRDIYG